MVKIKGILLSAVIYLIKGYQWFSRIYLPPRCRFYPSCSAYALIAVERFGLFKGGILSLRRILCCHPLSKKYGVDMVPENLGKKT